MCRGQLAQLHLLERVRTACAEIYYPVAKVGQIETRFFVDGHCGPRGRGRGRHRHRNRRHRRRCAAEREEWRDARN